MARFTQLYCKRIRGITLAVSRNIGELELKEEKLRPYLEYAKKVIANFAHTLGLESYGRFPSYTSIPMGKGDKKLAQLIILMKSKIPSYEGLVVAHLDLDDKGKWYEDIRMYLEVRQYS